MSLKGLDAKDAIEAYQAAATEPGGWLLLKYISRDEVDLLGRGNGGVAELREAVAGYPETSPLYGFLRFRRRSVLIRYVPTDTSRLVQTRVTVHFQAVMDKFSPHDAIFAISEAADLKESALSAACSLHAASGSTSSSTSSLRRRRLGEIAEDAEEARTSRSDAEKPLPPLPYELARRAERAEAANSRPAPSLNSADHDRTSSVEARPPSSTRPDAERERSSSAATVPLILSHTLAKGPAHGQSPTSPSGRESISASSPDGSSPVAPYSGFVYGTKTKVRLGPRPTMDPSRRAHTAGSLPRQNEGRPVSSLPAGIRMPQRRSQTANPLARPTVQRSRFPISIPSPPPRTPEVPRLTIPPLVRPATSPHPAGHDLKPPSTSSSAISSPARTPEKQKLMRALELRRKQLEMSRQEADSEQDVEELPTPSALEPEQSPVPTRQEDQQEPATTRNVLEKTQATEDAVDTGSEATSDPVESSHEKHDPVSSEAVTPVEPEQQPLPDTDPSPDASVVAINHEEAESEPQEQVNIDETLPDGGIGSSPSSSDNTAEHASTKASSVSDDADDDESNAATTRPVSFADNVDTEETEQQPAPAEQTPLEDDEPKDNVLDKISESDVHVNAEAAEASTSDSVTPASDLSEASRTPTPGEAEVIPISAELPPRGEDTPNSRFGHVEFTPIGSPRAARRNSASSSNSSLSGMESDSRPPSVRDLNGPRKKRRIVMEPIRTDISTENSDDNLLSDDSLMDELNSATVQEAKPVSVGKSPMAPGFPGSFDERRPSTASVSHRTVSSPIPSSRSAEALQNSTLGIPVGGNRNMMAEPFLLGAHDKQGPIAVIKKVNVSSGISQRIKALERVSSQTSRPNSPPQPPSSNSGSPTFTTLRKASLRSASGSNQARKVSESIESPVLDTGASVGNPVGLGLRQGRGPGGDGEFVQQQQESSPSSVKSQIIQDIKEFHAQSKQAGWSPKDADVGDGVAGAVGGKRDITPVQQPGDPAGNVTREGTSAVDMSTPLPRSSLPSPPSTRRPSIITIRSTSSRDGKQTRSPPPAVEPTAGNTSPHAKKPVSRNGAVDGRREGEIEPKPSQEPRQASPVSQVSEKDLAPSLNSSAKITKGLGITVESVPEQERASTEVGDVNVQFPDNMLWKRRFMRLDAEGYIVLTASKTDENSKVAARRYHISEFNVPFAPDLDMQEMPHSVVMDFQDGSSSLQCACETSAAQAHILQAGRSSIAFTAGSWR